MLELTLNHEDSNTMSRASLHKGLNLIGKRFMNDVHTSNNNVTVYVMNRFMGFYSEGVS